MRCYHVLSQVVTYAHDMGIKLLKNLHVILLRRGEFKVWGGRIEATKG